MFIGDKIANMLDKKLSEHLSNGGWYAMLFSVDTIGITYCVVSVKGNYLVSFKTFVEGTMGI